MVLRVDRSQREGRDPTLHARILFFLLGAGCAFAGILYGTGWLVTVGTIILAIGVLLRLLGDRRRRDAQEARWRAEAEGEDDHPAHDSDLDSRHDPEHDPR
jgi:hypothetical protein